MSGFFRRLVTLNRRDWIGLAAWLVCAVGAGLWCLPVMVGREVWQWKRYGLSRFEWEDVARYGAVIVAGACLAGSGGIVSWLLGGLWDSWALIEAKPL